MSRDAVTRDAVTRDAVTRDAVERPTSLAAARSFVLALCLVACGENRTFPGPTPFSPGEDPAFECLPNLDGVLEAGELPVQIGATVRYLANPVGVTRGVAVDGVVDPAGFRSWPLGDDFADDEILEVGPRPLSEMWFAPEFPEGDYVAPADRDGSILGVYHLDERALWLHGVASAERDPAEGRTLLPYDAPVPLFRLPIEAADRSILHGEISEGLLRGLAYRGTDTYEVEVFGAGRLDLPDWSFGQAWRVDQTVTVTPAIGEPVRRRITSWLFECFGEVARAEGALGSDAPVTQAVDLRRLTLR